MALTLRVLGTRAHALGSRAVHTFGSDGGRIGRAADNDWVLPDPERFVSSHHAVITVRDGRYHLLDISSNGTFVNGSRDALGRTAVHRLQSGDRLALGGYDLEVDLEGAPTTDESAGAPAADSAASREPVATESATIQALLRGAGLDTRLADGDDPQRVLALAGLLLRELATGLVAAGRERRTVGADLATGRIDLRRDPLGDAGSVDDALSLLLGADQRRLVPAVESVREAYRQLAEERRLAAAAAAAAVAATLKRLDPADLEQRFGPDTDDSAAARCWRHYRALYARTIGPDAVPTHWADDLTEALQALRKQNA